MVNVFFIEYAILLPIIEKSLANQISEIHIANASKTLFKKEPVVCSLSWFFPLTVRCLSAYCKPRSGHEQWDWGLWGVMKWAHWHAPSPPATVTKRRKSEPAQTAVALDGDAGGERLWGGAGDRSCRLVSCFVL
jgi:hypothetical protein